MAHGIFELPLNLKRSHFSYAHTDDDVDRLLEATEAAVRRCWTAAIDATRPVTCTIDLDAPGKQVGRLQLPKITNTGGWAYSFVPIATIANGDGPTVLVSGGNHGDEYEGQVAALRLLQELGPSRCTDGSIVDPVISTEASRAGTRLWPSGANFNRSFPGSPDGPPERAARRLLHPRPVPAGRRRDRHALGRPHARGSCPARTCTSSTTPTQRKAMLEGMLAWNSDFHFLYIDVNGSGLLPVEAESQGKVVITTELGGGGRVPAPVHRLAWSGLTNVLRHVGVLEGEVADARVAGAARCRHPRRARPRELRHRRGAGHLRGRCWSRASPSAGDPVGRLWFPTGPTRRPTVLRAPLDGVPPASGRSR